MNSINKQTLEELYTNQKLTTQEIAHIYNVHRTTISNKLKKYNIPTIKYPRKYHETKTQPINDIQDQLIIGSLLGDASIISRDNVQDPYFRISHCEKQKEYLLWKMNILQNLVFQKFPHKNIDKRENSIMYSFNTLSNPNLHKYKNMFYDNENMKFVPDNLKITPLVFAIWFMDDGTKTKRNSYRISTDSFCKEDNEKLIMYLQDSFQIFGKVLAYSRNGKEYYYLSFSKEESKRASSIILPWITKVESLKYKVI